VSSLPVLFLVFNRPHVTRKVFQAIRKAQPSRLYVAADGPRDSRPGEGEICREVRAIATEIDWDCEVKKLFRERNLGCGRAVREAIDWFFREEEYGVILEDDCLPGESFFPFMKEMLERYREDDRVMHVSGYSMFPGEPESGESYFFSRYPGIWGWGAWRRSWQKYDFELKKFQTFVSRPFRDLGYSCEFEKRCRVRAYNRVYSEGVDTWDYQWDFALRTNGGLCVRPWMNLVENIGFGADATHTMGAARSHEMNPVQEMLFPLKHPELVLPNTAKDEEHFKRAITAGMSPISRLVTMLRRAK